MIPAEEIAQLSGGLFSMDVVVEVNRLVFDYDQIIIVGPIFPHRSSRVFGQEQISFPGVSGPEILNFFHWLGAVVTNQRSSRQVHSCAQSRGPRASMITRSEDLLLHGREPGERWRFSLPERRSAWDSASELFPASFTGRPFPRSLSCSPQMADELWTGGKCVSWSPCSRMEAN